MDFINLHAQYEKYKDEIQIAISSVLESSSYSLSAKTKALEDTLSSYIGSSCVVCSSGSAALYLCLASLGIGSGDDVIVSSFSFKGVYQAVLLSGARVVFADIESDFSLSISSLEKRLTKKTKAIIVVNNFGFMRGIEKIRRFAALYGIVVIEDFAQSFGASYNAKMSGSICRIGATSFYPSKPFSAYGNGGAVFTNDEYLLDRCKELRNHATNRGFNFRLDELQAAILLVKFKGFKGELKRRIYLAKRYNSLLEGLGFSLPVIKEGDICSLYCLLHNDRDIIISYLDKHQMPTRIYYKKLQHEYFNEDDALYPNAISIRDRIFSLPLCAYLAEDDQDILVRHIKNSLEGV